MIQFQSSPHGGPGSHGFSLIELLIALAIVTLLAGALAGVAEPARAVFDRVPAALDLQQRGRIAIDVIANELRSAGSSVPAMHALGSFADLLPAFALSDPDQSGEAFSTLTVTKSAGNGGQGILEADQAGTSAAIPLAATICPNVMEVCGFSAGTTAMITDSAGRHDVFEVAATGAAARTLTPDRALSQAYPAGSVVIEIAQHTFSLARQADGSFSLIRETAAGAIQPVVDGVVSLAFRSSRHRVDITVSVQAATESLRRVLQDRVFRTSVHLRNVP